MEILALRMVELFISILDYWRVTCTNKLLVMLVTSAIEISMVKFAASLPIFFPFESAFVRKQLMLRINLVGFEGSSCHLQNWLRADTASNFAPKTWAFVSTSGAKKHVHKVGVSLEITLFLAGIVQHPMILRTHPLNGWNNFLNRWEGRFPSPFTAL